MSINILQSTPIQTSKVPQWVEEHIGIKVSRATVWRWTKRGCRGKKLKTFRAGGRVCTTVESLLEFFSDDVDNQSVDRPDFTSSESEAYLASEGI